MIKTMVMVHGGLSQEDARRAALSLLAMGMEAEVAREPEGSRWQVSVTEDELGAAVPVVREALTTDVIERRPAPPPTLLGGRGARIWTWQNAASSFAIAAACVGIHAAVHGGPEETARSAAMVAAGAVAPWLVKDGEWWRLLSAVFLHFDLKHLIGNTSALMFLGPPLAAQIGHLKTIVLFAVSGVAGNVVSQLIGNEGAVKAGASGGVCGLLGALAGVALITMASATDFRERRPAWQTLGALAALFGMIVGFAPGRDHYAHVGGLVAGVLLGRLFGVGAARNQA
ncbi:MAG: rhomboid family intramembrane serine protease [Candidatus Binatia bacterium]